jgi:hypothetical protein
MCFIDTPEVKKITDFIGSQKHTTPHIYFRIMGEDSGINLDVDISERDTLFREAAEVIVNATRLSIIVTKKTKTRLQNRNRPIRSCWHCRSVWEVKHVVYTS